MLNKRKLVSIYVFSYHQQHHHILQLKIKNPRTETLMKKTEKRGMEGKGRKKIHLNGAVKDAAESDAVLEDPVDLKDGGVRLLRFAVGHVVYVQHHLLLHLLGLSLPLFPLNLDPRGREGEQRLRISSRERGLFKKNKNCNFLCVLLP